MGYSSEHHLTNPALVDAAGRTVPKESLEVRRQRVINKSLLETIQVTNFNIFRVTLHLRFDFAADFVDIFEVRGVKRQRRGKLSTPTVKKDRVVYAYEGLDGARRRTEVKFSPAPDEILDNGARYIVSLRHREHTTITVTVTPADGERRMT